MNPSNLREFHRNLSSVDGSITEFVKNDDGGVDFIRNGIEISTADGDDDTDSE